MTKRSRSWDDFTQDTRTLATKLEHARSNNYQIEPLSKTTPGLTQTKGYEIAAALRVLRANNNGEQVAGRKIGFTNRNIWPEYNIDASNWSYMYRNTIHGLTGKESSELVSFKEGKPVVDISHFSNLQPKIEPEIVLGLNKPVEAGMTDAEVLSCVEWIAHGFEIVASVFPNWKFTATDTTAAFALHGLLLVGPKIPLSGWDASQTQLLEALSSFKIALCRDGNKEDEGTGVNVLGSPIKALRHLAELLDKDEFNLGLSPGEAVTTGTLTRALDIRHGDLWSTKIEGINIPGLEVEFVVNRSDRSDGSKL
ncbi:hypothetical protein LTR37_012292 [Vermiconidia calcicola]|uniref:Uncharacterized protein n=1 Tax=Vermiconidia calcicola TaxID=1690605 RepID=A0ACC3MZK0_9PEZI|nr:hypothetical protein LTR37_012292 [Vermiconidia calcicola]